MPESLHCGLFKPCVWRSSHRHDKPATSFCVAFDGAGDPCLKPAKSLGIEDCETPEFAFCEYHLGLLSTYFRGHTRPRTMNDEAPPLDIDAEPNAPWLESEGFVYFAKAGDKIKIGWSMNPEKRMVQMQVGNPDTIEWVARSGTPADEKFYHREFKDARIRGEWFHLTPAIEDTFQALRELANA